MDRYNLPTSTIIDNVERKFNADYRNIIQIFKILTDPDLLKEEAIFIALDYFYEDNFYSDNPDEAIKEMFDFISQCETDDSQNEENKLPLYDWEQDYNIIISPVNRVIGYDVRNVEFLHWWTFLSAFMEIGECTFNTFVGIRNKLNKGIKLENYEEKIYKENRNKLVLKKKYDSTTQDLLNEIMGY